jgi:serine/threonine-protein kinase
MNDDARVQELLDQLLDSKATPEDVCAQCPELLPQVRDRWQQMRRVRADLDALFPATQPPPPPEAQALPHIPGYEVESLLGRGGMGIVFRARHLKLNRLVALKMALGGAYAEPRERLRFQREAEAVAALRHPNIVQVYDVGDSDGQLYFTMEYVEGGSLAAKVAGTSQPIDQAVQWSATMARAVQEAHARGIIHRDLKPGNVLLTADGAPKITDFGLARRLESGAQLTQSGVPLGTPCYMSPEQAQGRAHAIGTSVDVYALGAILYELLTGRPPFLGETAAGTLQQVITQDPVAPSRLNPKVPRDLETICLKCLQKAPAHRYATALELAEDLGRYQRGEPITARPVSRPERVVRWVQRKPAIAALIVTALMLIGLAVAAGVSAWRLEGKRRAEIARWTPRLEAVKQLQLSGRFDEARALLETRPEIDVPELNDQIRVVLGELDLAQKLDQIRLNQAAVVDGRYNFAANLALSDREYEAALASAGIGGLSDAPADVAARIRASPIAPALVGALDDWAACAKDRSRRAWICEVARRADPDPSGWRDRVRDPDLSAEALTALAGTADVQDQSVQLLVAVAKRMRTARADSIEFMRRVQRRFPGDFCTNLTLGDALGQVRAEALRYYQAALAIRPESAAAQRAVARAMGEVGRLEDALVHFREAIRLEPRFARAMIDMAVFLSELGRHAEALEWATRGATIDPKDGRIQLSLSTVLDKLGRKEEMIDALRRAIDLEPGNGQTHIYLAVALMEADRVDEANREIEAARGAEPNSALVRQKIGQLLERQGRVDEAITEIEAAVRLANELEGAHTDLGNCWRHKRSPEKALVEYNKAIEIRPFDVEAIQARRGVMVQLGMGDAVLAEWQKALRENPAKHDAWYGYAELCLYLGREKEYQESCHELLGHFESSHEPLVCERTGRACLLGRLGSEDTARGAALIERAVNADPTTYPAWARAYFQLAQGLARYRLGDFEGVVGSIRGEAARVHGPFPHLILAMAHRRAGRTEKAWQSFAKAVRMYDWSPSRADNHDAWLYHSLRREAEPVVMPNLAALLGGQEKPGNSDERLALIAVCQSKERTAQAASLFADAFASEPQSGNRLQTRYRYDAACCAARAGCGAGEDARTLSDKERAALRDRARGWLRDDLAAKKALLARASMAERTALARQLESWLKDPALACVRDDGALGKLPPAERDTWHTLWRDTRSLLAEAKSSSSHTSQREPSIGDGA